MSIQIPDLDASAPLVAGCCFVIILAILAFASRNKLADDRRETQMVGLAVAAVFFLSYGLINQFAPVRARWRWDLSLFPALLVVMHGALLYRSKRPKMKPRTQASPLDGGVAGALRLSIDQQFGTANLLLRYGVPAFFIFAFSLGMSNAVLRELNQSLPGIGEVANPAPTSPTEVHWPLPALVGAAYGLVGAYLFTALNLGYRSLQQDVTPGAAIWCAATLAVGPVIAAVVAMVWRPDHGATADALQTATYFIAGFSPRYAVAILDAAARKINPTAQVAPARFVPVNQVRGVTDDIAERLGEEGITTVSAMARANPIRLLRNTRFDRRQIITWIDTALLMDALPEQWLGLERVGIVTATSLASFAQPCAVAQSNGAGLDGGAGVPATVANDPAESKDLEQLATSSNVAIAVLRTASKRLSQDPQVATVKALNEIEIDGDAASPSREPDSPPGKEAKSNSSDMPAHPKPSG